MQPRWWKFSEIRARVEEYFPEHQVYLRTNGRVRFLTLSTNSQLTLSALGLLFLGWIMMTSWTWYNESKHLAAKEQKIQEVRSALQSLTADLTTLETDIAAKARLLENRQTWLRSIIDQGLIDGQAKSGDDDKNAPTAAKKPDKDASRAAPRDQADPIVERANPDEIVAIYNARLDQLAAGQNALAAKLLGAAQQEFATIADMTAYLGLPGYGGKGEQSARNSGFGAGGPYIPASLTEISTSRSDEIAEVEEPVPALAEEWRQLQILREKVRSIPALVPVEHYFISSNFGIRRDPITRRLATHSGLDLAAWYGSKVMAATGGVVLRAGFMNGYGKMVEIDHGNGFKTRYGHLRRVTVKKGQKVAVGDVIAESGNTGRSTGPHLHYEVWANGHQVNPKPFIEASNHVLEIQRRAELIR